MPRDTQTSRKARRAVPTQPSEAPGASEQVLLRGDGFMLARFCCDASARAWKSENTIGAHAVLAFPTVPVAIRQRGHATRTADRTRAMLYNPQQTYQRGLLDPRGDRCLFIGLSDELATQFAGLLHGDETPDRFNTDHTPMPPHALLMLQTLARATKHGTEPAADALEESLLTLLQAIADAAHPYAKPEPQRDSTAAAHRDLAEAARAELARHFTENDSLAALAKRLHTSPFHLARIFRAHTGQSIVQHRRALRAMSALEDLHSTRDSIATIADRVGFPSHAPFSASFRQVFGLTPRQARRLAVM